MNGRLAIIRDGQIIKFVKKPYKVGFNAELGLKMGKEVLYITERAVFRLTGEGLVLEEYAPGVDIERDILAKMEFKPIISRHLQPMDDAVFRDGPWAYWRWLRGLLGVDDGVTDYPWSPGLGVYVYYQCPTTGHG